MKHFLLIFFIWAIPTSAWTQTIDDRYVTYDTISHHLRCLVVEDTFVIDSIWWKEAWKELESGLAGSKPRAKLVEVCIIKAHPVEHPYFWFEIATPFKNVKKMKDIAVGDQYHLIVRPKVAGCYAWGDLKWGSATFGKYQYTMRLEPWASNLYVTPNLQRHEYIPCNQLNAKGEKEGLWIQYSRFNGRQTVQIMNFKHNLRTGQYSEFYINGDMLQNGFYRRGEKVGDWMDIKSN